MKQIERLIKYFVPEEYDLDLYINKHKKTLSGIVEISGKAKKTTIKLHAVKMKILSVFTGEQTADFSHKDGILTINLEKTGKTTLKISFELAITESMDGVYLSRYEIDGREELIIATQFESHFAREAFPCVDEPEAKAIFKVSITTPNDGDEIISNMPMVSAACAPEGCRNYTVAFEPTPRMSTYLLAFVIGKFHKCETLNKHGVKVASYCALNHSQKALKYANEIAAKSLDFFAEIFDTPYPLPKLDQVALPDFDAGAMENWGLMTFREAALLADENSPIDSKEYVAIVVAHEISHQWFGDLVTMKWWDDLWLNESFASLAEYIAVDHIFPEYEIWNDFYTGTIVSAFRRDCLPGVQSICQDVVDPAELSSIFDGAIVYSKGAHLMLMLQRLIGEENFFKGLRDYFHKFAYKNTTGGDLWSCLAPYADFDVREFMTSWISTPGYPVVDASTATQHRFLLGEKMPKSNYTIGKICADLSGNYILNLTPKEINAKLSHFSNTPLEEKLRLLIDCSLLAKTDLLSSKYLFDILLAIKNEQNEAVWTIAAGLINDLKIFFEPNSKEEKQYKTFVSKLAEKQYISLGLLPKKDEPVRDTKLRTIILPIMSFSENKNYIKDILQLYDKDFSKLNPESRANILAAKLRYEETPELFDYFAKQYKQTIDPELKTDLSIALTSTRDPQTAQKLLKLLKDTKTIRPQDTVFFFIRTMQNPAATDLALDWLYKNWDFIEKITGDKSLDYYPRYVANQIRTAKDLENYQTFFEPKKDNLAIARAISVGISEILSRLALINSDEQKVINRLEKLIS
jgi:aminopeptidase N